MYQVQSLQLAQHGRWETFSIGAVSD